MWPAERNLNYLVTLGDDVPGFALIPVAREHDTQFLSRCWNFIIHGGLAHHLAIHTCM